MEGKKNTFNKYFNKMSHEMGQLIIYLANAIINGNLINLNNIHENCCEFSDKRLNY